MIIRVPKVLLRHVVVITPFRTVLLVLLVILGSLNLVGRGWGSRFGKCVYSGRYPEQTINFRGFTFVVFRGAVTVLVTKGLSTVES